MLTETMDSIGMVKDKFFLSFSVHNFHSEGGAAGDKCWDTYHGPEAFSEPETQAVRDFVMAQ